GCCGGERWSGGRAEKRRIGYARSWGGFVLFCVATTTTFRDVLTAGSETRHESGGTFYLEPPPTEIPGCVFADASVPVGGSRNVRRTAVRNLRNSREENCSLVLRDFRNGMGNCSTGGLHRGKRGPGCMSCFSFGEVQKRGCGPGGEEIHMA